MIRKLTVVSHRFTSVMVTSQYDPPDLSHSWGLGRSTAGGRPHLTVRLVTSVRCRARPRHHMRVTVPAPWIRSAYRTNGGKGGIVVAHRFVSVMVMVRVLSARAHH